MKKIIVARYGEIGTKSSPVRSRMTSVLRQRISDRLEYEAAEIEKISEKDGRIYCYIEEPEEHIKDVAEMPGVSTASTAMVTDADSDSIDQAFSHFDTGDSFAVRVNTANNDFSSSEMEKKLGGLVEERTGSEVDLDSPETRLEADIRGEKAFVFADRHEGPDGFPVGSGGDLGALISGGIDSPVAAYRMMSRGSDIVPIYFYNRPIAAEDHLMRFRSAVEKLKRFHPSKNWEAVIVDMEEINRRLMDKGRGRMVVQRRSMFRIAEKVADIRKLEGLVTGESMSQKSSQTARNMATTSITTSVPIHRPLLGENKNRITEQARKLGTFEEATIDSACSSMAPDHAATRFNPRDARRMEEDLELEDLEEEAFSDRSIISL